MSYNRFLFIGLGGSGGSTLGHIKLSLESWLRETEEKWRPEAEWGKPIELPRGWQFLHFDTPPDCDAVPSVDPSEYEGLVAPGVNFAAVQAGLDADINLHEEIKTWRVDPASFPYALVNGAGQFRAIGKTVALAYRNVLKTRIAEAYDTLADVNATSELTNLYTQILEKDSDGVSPLRVVVVSSLAGGTGAGMLLTVSDIIRAMGKESHDDIFGILYTPDVFGQGGNFSGTPPNSLAAISELLNGYWWGGHGIVDPDDPSALHPPEKQPPSLASVGLPNPINATGPRMPFLVGLTNSQGVNHGNKDSLFEIVGRALMTWATDEVVQRSFIAFTIGNWKQASMGNPQRDATLMTGGLESERGYPCLSSLGFSRLSMGTEYFKEYAARRLVRESLEHLVNYHTDSQEAVATAKQIGVQDGELLAKEIASRHWKSLLIQSGLDELGPENNQIIDALIPSNEDEIKREFRDETTRLAGIGSGKGKKSAAEWMDALEASIMMTAQEFEANYSAAVNTKVTEWIKNTQRTLLDETNRSVSQRGLKVTQEMLAEVSKEIKRISIELGEHDIPNFATWAADWKQYVQHHFDELGKGDIPATNSSLTEAIELATYYIGFLGNKVRAERAEELTKDMLQKVFFPLDMAFSNEYEEALISWEEVAQSWPSWEEVEAQEELSPMDSEFVMIGQDSWHSEFGSLLKASLEEGTEAEQRNSIRNFITQGDFSPAPEGSDQLIDCQMEWMPYLPHFTEVTDTPQMLNVSVNADVHALKNRALLWMNRPGSPFGLYLSQSLRSYLDMEGQFDNNVSPAIMKSKQNRFKAQLQSAIKASEPLVDVNSALVDSIYTDAQKPSTKYVTSIPLEAHSLQNDIEQILDVAGIDSSGVLSSDSTIKTIDITTTLATPHNVLAIKSLLNPVAGAWSKAVAAGDTTGFWSKRRGTVLREFVPIPQALLHCMVRGWFSGLLLGKIDTTERPIRITDPQNARVPAKFPKDDLSSWMENDPDQGLSKVLENLILAYVDCTNFGSLEPLNAYIQLRDLGWSGDKTGTIFKYDSLSTDLKHLIQTGKIDGNIIDPPVFANPLFTNAEPTPEGRKEALASMIEGVRERFDKLHDDMQRDTKKDPGFLTFTKLWRSIYPVIAQELNQMARTIRSEDSGRNTDLF